ncbi:copper resistance D family protein [Acidisphaera sp. S103]|uniref:copper resistance D family protein n=1 Tax=Acidisphaera sp. S103 TaxID=1747223 RepID=UPI00131E097C|nr:CopD family protein [Acidisphaera sp. S103]
MDLLVDLFGYLSIVVHGLTILSQSMALGGVLFLVLLARPLAPRLGRTGIADGTARIAGYAALGLLLAEAATVALQTAVLVDTVDLTVLDVLHAQFAVAGIVKTAAAVTMAGLLLRLKGQVPALPLLALTAIELAAATLTTHAAARLDNRGWLLAVEGLHQLGAAIWIGGIPCFLLTLARVRDGITFREVGSRFSRMSMAGVACILVSGITMSLLYIGSWQGFYGTAFGVMVGAKIAMFLMLLGLGGMNFLLVERLRTNPLTSINRLRRFAEVEFGIGIAIFFAAASLTSVPPAVDLTQDRVSWHEIVERNIPEWPRLSSPDHDTLALPALQEKLDQEAVATKAKPQVAFVPGSGELPPRNAADIAWSEYNHHWAGLIVGLVGLLALLNRAGVRWARHWPLAFLGLAVFLFFRSDPETWPMGDIGFLDSFRDVEVVQHRFFVLLIVVFAFFEWRVRTAARVNRYAVLVFPLLCAAGGTMLLTHSHAIANVKDQLLIELTHTPLALAGIAAGWARWLEIRLNPRDNPVAWQIASWVWPMCILFCGLLLLGYREA